jgi:hypothetical protein
MMSARRSVIDALIFQLQKKTRRSANHFTLFFCLKAETIPPNEEKPAPQGKCLPALPPRPGFTLLWERFGRTFLPRSSCNG